MKTLKVIKEDQLSNRVVIELNAAVLTATFKKNQPIQKADLYECINESNKIVAHGTCGPINGVFVKSILIEFPSIQG